MIAPATFNYNIFHSVAARRGVTANRLAAAKRRAAEAAEPASVWFVVVGEDGAELSARMPNIEDAVWSMRHCGEEWCICVDDRKRHLASRMPAYRQYDAARFARIRERWLEIVGK